MGLAGYRFNPANIVTLPLVIGIGVAYGVYVVDRFREDPALRLFIRHAPARPSSSPRSPR